MGRGAARRKRSRPPGRGCALNPRGTVRGQPWCRQTGGELPEDKAVSLGWRGRPDLLPRENQVTWTVVRRIRKTRATLISAPPRSGRPRPSHWLPIKTKMEVMSSNPPRRRPYWPLCKCGLYVACGYLPPWMVVIEEPRGKGRGFET